MKKPLLFTLLFVCLCGLLQAQSKWSTSSLLWLEKCQTYQQYHVLAGINDQINESQLESKGIKVKTKAGNIWSLEVPAASLSWLEQQPGVKQLEFGFQAVTRQAQDTNANRLSQVYRLQENPGPGINSAYTGKDIIVGIIDIGFQLDHPTFFDTTGTHYRVSRYWNQQDPQGPAPSGFSYGTLFSDKNEMWQQRDFGHTHGTHVAGIAAGSGYGLNARPYRGVAYEAELVFVNIVYFNDQIPEGARSDYLLANPAIIDGMDYIFRYADSVGKPAVVNLSWGMHTGPHDGTSLFDQAVENLTGPGKLFVGAAGNDGWSALHFSDTLRQDTIGTFAMERFRLSEPDERLWVDSWGSAGTDFQLRLGLADTNGVIQKYGDFFSASLDQIVYDTLVTDNGDSLIYRLACQASFAGNNKPNILCELINKAPLNRVVVFSYTSDSTQLHAWNSGQPDRYTSGNFWKSPRRTDDIPGFKGGDALNTVGENGGTGRKTISVGAYSASSFYVNIHGETIFSGTAEGYRAGFSSFGTTPDGRVKPDICAPGVAVISAFNRDVTDPGSNRDVVDSSIFRGNSHYWGAASGTSMAAPHAAGIVALMLQARPSLSPEEALYILHRSTDENDRTGALPNAAWGHGPLIAYKALLLTQAPLSTESEELVKWSVYPNPTQGTVYLWHSLTDKGDIQYRLLNLQGQEVVKGICPEGELSLDVSAGLYFLELEVNGSREVFRLQVLH